MSSMMEFMKEMPNDTAKSLQILRKTAQWIGWSVLLICLFHALLRAPSVSFGISVIVGIAFLWLGYELRALEFHRKHAKDRWYQLGFLSIAYTLLGIIKGGSKVSRFVLKAAARDSRVFDDRKHSQDLSNKISRGSRWNEQMTDYQQGHSPWSPD